MTADAAVETASGPVGGVATDGVPLNRFHIAVLAFQRARHLQNGAPPRVAAGSHRATRIALLEVLADTISWTVLEKPDRAGGGAAAASQPGSPGNGASGRPSRASGEQT
jgi:DNA-directed RNA polymerase subunit K/omega